MKKLIAVIIMLIFILPFSTVEAGSKDKRYKKNSREYHRYDRDHRGYKDRGRHRGHGHSRYYNRYRHDHRKKVYKYKGHYRDRHEWDRHHRKNDRRYRHGEYHYDKQDRLMFSYCLENEESTRRESSREEMCFSFSIGN